MLLLTKSTGIMSPLVSLLATKYLIAPIAVNKVKAPAAARVSIHPGYGCSCEQIMIEGLKMRRGTLPLCLASALSARFFVKV